MRTPTSSPAAWLIPTLLVGCASPAPAPEPWPQEPMEGSPMYTLLEPGGIPAIDEPRFAEAAEADAFLEPDEPVLGIVGRDGTAKAYSAWHLDGHEVVNDDLDGEPIAATW